MENFKEFAFKLQDYLFLMDARYEKAFNAVEDDPEREITEADFKDSARHENPALVKQAGQP